MHASASKTCLGLKRHLATHVDAGMKQSRWIKTWGQTVRGDQDDQEQPFYGSPRCLRLVKKCMCKALHFEDVEIEKDARTYLEHAFVQNLVDMHGCRSSTTSFARRHSIEMAPAILNLN